MNKYSLSKFKSAVLVKKTRCPKDLRHRVVNGFAAQKAAAQTNYPAGLNGV
jgi:hypothetical protein